MEYNILFRHMLWELQTIEQSKIKNIKNKKFKKAFRKLIFKIFWNIISNYWQEWNNIRPAIYDLYKDS